MKPVIQNINNKLLETLKKKNFYQDKKAKSLSFFCKEKIRKSFLDKSLIDHLLSSPIVFGKGIFFYCYQQKY